jgi:OPA family sugar phosphate sensor protein UhpC-like MFS transporter
LNGVTTYNFTSITVFWIGASILSMLLTLLVWNAKAYKK